MYQNNQDINFRDTIAGRLMTQSQFKSSQVPPPTHPLPSQAVYLSSSRAPERFTIFNV